MFQPMPVADPLNVQQAAVIARCPYFESPPAGIVVWGLDFMNGTGAVCTLEAHRDRAGYPLFVIIEQHSDSRTMAVSFADLMLDIKIGFGRTFSRLPAVFGVSRQTLYNWLAGEVPKDSQQPKLVELAAAARAFSDSGFKPTAAMLTRTVAGGKSFLELIAMGTDGADTAKSLMRIVERGLKSRARLDAALASHKQLPFTTEDIGAPSVNEDL